MLKAIKNFGLLLLGLGLCAPNLWAQGGGQFGGTAGGSGSGGTISSCGTTNAIGLFTAATTIGCDANTTDASSVWTFALAGAASTSPVNLTGTPFAGTGTTSTPLLYFNGGSAPTTWSTSGTYLGFNTPNAFAGNILDVHTNGGTSLLSIGTASINATGSITGGNLGAGASGSLTWNTRGGMAAPADGVRTNVNAAFTGFTRLDIGPDTSAFPALCPQTGTTPYLAFDVAGACTTGTFIKSAQTLQVTGADVTCGTSGTLTPCTAFTTITGLTVALPTVSTTWSYDCDLITSQATAAAANQIGVQTATNASTNLTGAGIAYTAAAVSTAAAFTGVSSTSAQSIVTFTPGGTGTKLPIHIHGTIEGTSTSGTTFNLQVLTGNASDLLTIYRGSACYLY